MVAPIDWGDEPPRSWLPGIGVLVWLAAGSTSIARFADHPAGERLLPWALCYAAFGLLFGITASSRRSPAPRLLALLAQAALAVILVFLGMPLFEGALLAVVATQTATLLPLWAALLWAALQLLPLWLAVSARYGPVELAKSLTSYAGVCAFAIVALRLFEGERRARSTVDRTIQELLASRAQLADRARGAERLRIARDLHDDLGHRLTALALHLELAKRSADGVSRHTLEEIDDQLRLLLREARAAIRDLRGEGFDLATAIRGLIDPLSGPAIHLDLAPDRPLDPAAAQVAFRVVQEAITNALRHAGASRLRVKVRALGDHLEVAVVDDGCGCSHLAPGSGLTGMRERVEGLGGSLSIRSGPHHGTRIRARIPMGRSR